MSRNNNILMIIMSSNMKFLWIVFCDICLIGKLINSKCSVSIFYSKWVMFEWVSSKWWLVVQVRKISKSDKSAVSND